MSIFDGYKQQLNTTVQKIMGDVAVWYPSDGSGPEGINATVLFSKPTIKDKLADVEYNPFDWQMEFHVGSFTNLKALVDKGETEIITINGTEYFVKSVISNWDGDVSLAKLEAK